MNSTSSFGSSQVILPPPIEDNQKALEEAIASVKTQVFQLRRCLENQRLMDALKNACVIFSELRASMLAPKQYYELYMTIFDEMRHFSSYLKDNVEGNPSFGDLYELVQYAGNIVPRLYLMITVGAVYIHLNLAPRSEILKDMLEMCRGVQNPLRGLFLRHYLGGMTKDELLGHGTGIQDSVDFIMDNFAEMNKLWVRMQYQGPTREKEKRENERNELKTIVGTNLVRLSQVEGVTLEMYKKDVLPRILEQVISCRDIMAQEYLMDVIIQAFPSDWHSATLTPLLEAVGKLVDEVNVKAIVIALMDRLSGQELVKEYNLFDIFWEATQHLIRVRAGMPFANALALLTSMLQLCSRCYPNNIDYVDAIYGYIEDTINTKKISDIDDSEPEAGKLIHHLLNLVLSTFDEPKTFLKMKHYEGLIHCLSVEGRRKATSFLLTSILKMGELDDSQLARALDILITYCEHLLHQDVVEDQIEFSRFIRFHVTKDMNRNKLLKKKLGRGKWLVRFSFPIFIDQLITKTKDEQTFHFVHTLVTQMLKEYFQPDSSAPRVFSMDYVYDLAFNILLEVAIVADGVNLQDVAYEFMSQGFSVYEEHISDSKSQWKSIHLMIQCLQKCQSFTKENFDTLASRCALYASKLLKRPDQCHAVIACACLFWRSNHKDEKRVLECLQKALKVADSCMDPSVNVELFVDILNQYIFYYENHNSLITLKHVNGLIELIQTNIINIDPKEIQKTISYFENTKKYLVSKEVYQKDEVVKEEKMVNQVNEPELTEPEEDDEIEEDSKDPKIPFIDQKVPFLNEEFQADWGNEA